MKVDNQKAVEEMTLNISGKKKCVNKWCNNEADGYMCLRCEDIYYDAVIEAQEQDRKLKDCDYEVDDE